MGRRSKADLFDLVDRILRLHSVEKLTIQEITDQLKNEGIDISREAVRRSLKTSRELAANMRRSLDEARVMMDEVRNNPNTDIAEALVTHIGGMLLRESQELDELTFEDSGELVLAASRIAQSQVKIGGMRLKYRSGFEDAKKEILSDLKADLAGDPELYERLAEKVRARTPKEGK